MKQLLHLGLSDKKSDKESDKELVNSFLNNIQKVYFLSRLKLKLVTDVSVEKIQKIIP